jgi:methylase of polypeptide subunit release factors
LGGDRGRRAQLGAAACEHSRGCRIADFPIADTKAAEILGDSLREIAYSEAAVNELLGEDASGGTEEDAAGHERRLPQGRVATVIRLLFLQRRVPRHAAIEALGERGVDALGALGLAAIGDEVVPRVRVLPIGPLLIVGDGYAGSDDPADYVAIYTPTSRVLDSLTPRPRVARALDVGTGSGIHALLAARHADRVVATDVNPRALVFTELNAVLNGVTNVECRQGSLFEPVAGETFGLITCNAPYVVSPENRWAYRDSGFDADEFSARVVRDAAAHLAEHGYATLLVSWLAQDEDAPDERAFEWSDETGCDSWILPVWDADPISHATSWNSHLDGEEFSRALDEWTGYFERLGVRWISEGAVLLHKRSGGGEMRVDSIEEDELEVADDQIRRAFAARERLAELERGEDLLEERLSLEMAVSLEEELEPDEGEPAIVDAQIRLLEGTSSALDVDSDVLDVVAMLDGRTRLGDLIDTAAERLGLAEGERAQLERDAVEAARELLELGALGID